MAVREALVGFAGVGAALVAGAETRPVQIAGEASMTPWHDESYATYGDQLDCLGAAMQVTVEAGAATEESESREEVLQDPDCPTDPNQARVSALEALGHPADTQAYAPENGAATTKPPENETIMGELRDARHAQASTRARKLGAGALGFAFAGGLLRRVFSRDGHATGDHD